MIWESLGFYTILKTPFHFKASLHLLLKFTNETVAIEINSKICAHFSQRVLDDKCIPNDHSMVFLTMTDVFLKCIFLEKNKQFEEKQIKRWNV